MELQQASRNFKRRRVRSEQRSPIKLPDPAGHASHSVSLHVQFIHRSISVIPFSLLKSLRDCMVQHRARSCELLLLTDNSAASLASREKDFVKFLAKSIL